VLQNCSVPSTRAAVDVANSSKCPQNVALLEEALALRREAARLLGFESHAAFVLRQRMASQPDTVASFLADLSDRVCVIIIIIIIIIHIDPIVV
jgi:Zn-dependent oligopeptidase